MRVRLLNVHVEYVGDVLSTKSNLQRLAIETLALTDRTGHPQVSKEIHFHFVAAVAFASLAPTPACLAGVHIETESARFIAADLCVRQLRIKGANLVEKLDISGWVGSRRSTNRGLIDIDDLIKMLNALDPIMQARLDLLRPI